MARRKRRRYQRGRWRFAAIYKLLTFLLICGAIAAALFLFFKIDDMEVSGNKRYTQQQVVEASGISEGANLYLLDKYSVANRIIGELPYVESVRISRKLPGTLCFEVTECSNLAVIGNMGSYWLISPTGKLVDTVSVTEQEQYIAVSGLNLQDPQQGKPIAVPEEQADSAELLLKVMGHMKEKGMLADCSEIHMEDEDNVILRQQERFEVKIPRSADMNYKLDYLAAVLEKLDEGEKGTIDLTHEGAAHFIPE